MIKKKTSTRKKRKKSRKKIPLMVFAVIAGIIVLMAYSFFQKPVKKKQAPLYEEGLSKASIFNITQGKIDRMIHETLDREGIRKEKIFFAKIEPRQEKGHEWDFTEIGITFDQIENILHIAKVFEEALLHFKPAVHFKKNAVSSTEIFFDISIDGLVTHKIRLVVIEQEKAVATRRPKVAIIIDDIGYDYHIIKQLDELDFPLTLSILPFAPHQAVFLEEAGHKKWELLLHLPMEPKNYPDLNPGTGALLLAMTPEELKAALNEALSDIPGIIGVNNHMGSAFTENKDKMRLVMEEIHKRNLLYIDSRTTSRTMAFQVAKSLGMQAASRSIFLDNDPTPEAIKLQIERLMGVAKHSGVAIGIGHPHRKTIEALKNYIPDYQTEIEMIVISGVFD